MTLPSGMKPMAETSKSLTLTHWGMPLAVLTVTLSTFVLSFLGGRVGLFHSRSVSSSNPEPIPTYPLTELKCPQKFLIPSHATSSVSADAVLGMGKERAYIAQLKPRGRLVESIRAIKAGRDGSDNGTLVLRLHGTVLPQNPPISGFVFVIQPGAPLPRSTDDSGYIGYFSLGGAEDAGKPLDSLMELNATVRKLAKKDWFQADNIHIGIIGLTDDDPTTVVPVVFQKATLTLELPTSEDLKEK